MVRRSDRSTGNSGNIFFPEIVPTGTKIGTLTDEICTELGLDKIDVMAVGHDTQSALVSVPTSEEDFIFPELVNMVTAWNRACRTYYQ